MVTRRRRLLAGLGAASVALAGCGDDGGDSGVETITGTPATPLAFSTPAFEDGGPIPERFTGVGADVSPELVVESVPQGTETLALVVDDPDAPGYSGEEGFVHWLLWNVPADVGSIPADVPQEESELDVEAGYRRDDLEAALDGRVPDTHRITGEFER